MNLLIPYVQRYTHTDPLFREFTYGDIGNRGRKLKTDVERGDYLFFHTSVGGRKYITAYYVAERVLSVADAVADRRIVAKYKNPHIQEWIDGTRHGDDTILFGDPITSRELERPLLFDRALAERLSLNISFPEGRMDTQVIGSATRAWRELTEQDVEILLNAIEQSERERINPDVILSTDEVTEIIEKDIEVFLESNPTLVGENLRVRNRQLGVGKGRIDLLFEGNNGELVVAELKLNKIGRDAVDQLHDYMSYLGKEENKPVRGIIVCKGVMPTFIDEFKGLKNIKIFQYGWQFKVFPWSG